MPVAKRLEDHLCAFLREQKGSTVRPGLLVAVSGGCDSSALLHLAVATRERHGCRVVAGHVNHRVRPDADSEENRLRELADRLGIDFNCVRRRERGQNPLPPDEATLRRFRYSGLKQIARQAGCEFVLLAHHRDDQAETLLLNLLRGTGVAGLAGMPARRRRFLRPFLDISRSTLETYLKEIGETWVEDPTNSDLSRTRNILRHRILPLIDSEVRPKATDAIARTAQHLSKVRAFLESETEICLSECRLPAPPGEVRLDARRLGTYHQALIEHALRHAVRMVRGSTLDIPSSQWQRIVSVHARGGDGRFLIPSDTLVEMTGRMLRISPVREAGSESHPATLPWRGQVRFLEGSVRTRRLRARRTAGQIRVRGLSRMQLFDVDAVHPPFIVRSPVEGDRIEVAEEGTKKVADLLSERGVPKSFRADQPVIADSEGILWIPGIRRTHRAMVDEDADRVWVVRWIGKLPVDAALMGGETRR